jgi:hypothetical protein
LGRLGDEGRGGGKKVVTRGFYIMVVCVNIVE